MHIQRLFIYPVKSLLPVEVKVAEITNEGLRFDRQYILARVPPGQASGLVEHLTIKTTYELCLFSTAIDQSWSKLIISHIRTHPESRLIVPLTPSPLSLLNSNQYQVSIFGTHAIGVDMGEDCARFFTKHLLQPVRLLFIGGTGRREIPGASYVPFRSLSLAANQQLQPQRIRFADAAPLLVTSSASEDDTRLRLPRENQDEDLILRLRPNIHIDANSEVPPYDEDYWKSLLIRTGPDGSEEAIINCIFKCVRCLSLNVDMEKGKMIETNRQLYGLLARDRRVNPAAPHKPVFGQYSFATPSGAILRVGDKVEIIERTPP